MLFHGQMLWAKQLEVASGPVDRAFVAFCRGGWCGVDLFFVLSGFLITGILLDARPKPGAGETRRYFASFYARRTLRIFPLHYALLALFFVVVPMLPHAGPGAVAREIGEYAQLAPEQWWYWLYLGNVRFALHGFAGHGIPDVLWSLAIEEQFYLAWPVVVLLLPRRGLVGACVGVILTSVAFRLALLAWGAGAVPVYVLTPGRLDGLAIGALVAALARGPAATARLGRTAWFMATTGVLTLAWIVADHGTLDEYAPDMQRLGYTALALLGGGAVAAVVASPGSAMAKVACIRPLTTLGKYAYAMYLIHLTVQAAMRATLFRSGSLPTILGSRIPALLAFDAASIAVSLLAAWLSWNLLERRFLQLKERFPMPSGAGGR